MEMLWKDPPQLDEDVAWGPPATRMSPLTVYITV